MYLLLFIILSIAEILFTTLYFFITKKIDRILLLGLIIYAGTMIIVFITYKIERYRKKRKELMNSLPEQS